MNSMKKRKIVFLVVTIISFVVLVLGNFYTREAYAINIYFTSSYMISDQLFTGDVIEQEFTLREEDQGVGLIMGTYVTNIESGTAVAELFDLGGNKIAETEVSLVGIDDNSYVPFDFGDLDESLYNQKLKVRFTFLDIDNQLLAVYSSATDAELYEATVNGEVRAWNIAMLGIKDTVYLEYHDFRRFYLFVIGVFALYVGMFKIKWKELNPKAEVQHCKDELKKNWKKLLLAMGVVLGSTVIGIGAESLLSAESKCSNPYRAFVIAVAVFLVIFSIVFRKYIWKKAHIFFFIVSMLVGSVYIVSQPPTPTGYDEQIHYTVTSYLSWGAKDRISISDYLMLSMYTQQKYYDIFQQADREAWVEEVNAIDGQGGVYGYFDLVGITDVPYMLTSIILYVLRIFKVDFITRYLLGKMVNLFLYSSFFAAAIKLLKGRGKMVAAMVGLIPTNMYMATSYGYDWWVVSLIVLGFAIFISELQKKEKISTKKFALSTAVICTGMLPKAVYFPLLFPMMLLKKNRYEESKKCRAITIIGAVTLVASFILPLFISVDAGAIAGGGDERGGLDVNAGEQVVYILTNLWEYLKVLFQFMWDYLNPDGAWAYLTASAYQGNGNYFTVCMIILIIAAALDNSENVVLKGREPLAVFGNYIGVIGAVVLVITALYVSYTAVGADTVNGCQPRYLLPIIFPFLFFAGENKMQVPDEVKSKAYIWGVVGMALIFLLSVYNYFIIRY